MRLSVLLLVAVAAVPCSAFYLHLDQRICFADEVGYEREPAHVHYQIPDLAGAGKDKTDTHFVTATVSDPENNIIHSEVIKAADGSFSFLSTGVAGEYHICFEPSSFMARKAPKLTVDLESGSTIDYSKVQTQDDLSKVEQALQDLKGQMHELRDEMGYVIRRQVPFHHTSESTGRRVWIWSCIQVMILIIMTSWQIFNLKSFFMAKKIV